MLGMSAAQPIARDDAARHQSDERLRNQIGEAVQDVRWRDLRARNNRARRIQPEDAGKYREAPQDHSLGLAQQFIAPVERRPQRLVPRQCSATAAGQDPEAIVNDVWRPPLLRVRRRVRLPARSPAGCRRASGRSPRSSLHCVGPGQNEAPPRAAVRKTAEPRRSAAAGQFAAPPCLADKVLRRFLAVFRSAVSNPSVNRS